MPWQNEKNKLSKFEVLKKILWNIWKGEFSRMAMTMSDFSQKILAVPGCQEMDLSNSFVY